LGWLVQSVFRRGTASILFFRILTDNKKRRRQPNHSPQATLINTLMIFIFQYTVIYTVTPSMLPPFFSKKQRILGLKKCSEFAFFLAKKIVI
jgi:hypothetical protein